MEYSEYKEMFLNEKNYETPNKIRNKTSSTCGMAINEYSENHILLSSTNQSSQQISYYESQHDSDEKILNENLEHETSNSTISDYFDFNSNHFELKTIFMKDKIGSIFLTDKEYKDNSDNTTNSNFYANEKESNCLKNNGNAIQDNKLYFNNDNTHCLPLSINHNNGNASNNLNKADENIKKVKDKSKELKTWIKTTKNIFLVHKPIYSTITKIRIRNRLAASRYRNKEAMKNYKIIKENNALTYILKSVYIKGHFDCLKKNKKLFDVFKNLILNKKENYDNMSDTKKCVRNKIYIKMCIEYLNNKNNYFMKNNNIYTSNSTTYLNNTDAKVYSDHNNFNQNQNSSNISFINNKNSKFFSNYDFYGNLLNNFKHVFNSSNNTITINNSINNPYNINYKELLLNEDTFSSVLENFKLESIDRNDIDNLLNFSFIRIIKNIYLKKLLINDTLQYNNSSLFLLSEYSVEKNRFIDRILEKRQECVQNSNNLNLKNDFTSNSIEWDN